MLRKKFFKILSVLVAIIVTSSLFLLPASAASEYPSNSFVFDDFCFDWISVLLLDENGDLVSDLELHLWQTESNKGLFCSIVRLDGGSFVAGEKYSLQAVISPNEAMISYDNFVVGSYAMCIPNSRFNVLDYSYGFRSGAYDLGSTVYHQDSINEKVILGDYQYYEGYRYTYKAGRSGVGYNRYESYLHFTPVTTQSELYLDILEIDFKQITPDEAAADELSNGWQSDSSIDSAPVDDYISSEDKLKNDTLQGRESAIQLFNDFDLSSDLGSGLYAATAIITQFIDSEDSFVSAILSISLAIGVFGFVLGIVPALYEFRISFKRSSDKRLGLPPRRKG